VESADGFAMLLQGLMEDDGMEFPKFHFFVMGLLDLLHVRLRRLQEGNGANCTNDRRDGICVLADEWQGLMLFIAGGRTDPTQTLLFMQASIPISACMSAAFFGVRYGTHSSDLH
jgi:hypothetical protein